MNAENLVASKCVPCEGGVPQLTVQQAAELGSATPEWVINEPKTAIARKINCGNFVSAVKLIQQIATIAEEQQHHPDLHLTGYRHLKIVLTTHAISGLSENDFIVAAHIDRLLKDQ